jgi:peptidyl-prolyl cis-trans isomerase C
LGVGVRARIILAVGLGLFAAGCDKKAEGQTVAVVNGEEITAPELNAELASANVATEADKQQARARILQGLIDRRLLAQHARAEGLDKSPEYLNRQRRMTEDLLIGMLGTRQINAAQLPSNDDINRFAASRPNMFAKREFWNLEQIRFEVPKDKRVIDQMAATKSLDDVAKLLSANGVRFARAKNRLDTAIVPLNIYGRVATLPAGEPFIIPVGNQAVASVIVSREPAPLTVEQARPQAVAVMRREQGAKFMQDRIKSLRQAAKIEYQGGFAPPKGQ